MGLALLAGGCSESDTAADAMAPSFDASPSAISSVDMSMPHSIDGLYMSPDGTLYAGGGWQSDEVIRISDSGEVEVLSTGHRGPIHIVQGADSSFYVTNYNDGSLSKVDADGTSTTIATGLDGPSGITVNQEGQVFIAGWGAAGNTGTNIYRLSEDGMSVAPYAVGQGISVPQGLACDESGNVYVANAVDSRIHKIAPDGTVSMLADLPGDTGYNIAHMVYGNGRLYATGAAVNAIYEIKLDGTYRILAGLGATGTLGDARFVGPGGLAISPDGSTLWIVDPGGPAASRLRRITLPDSAR